MVVMKVEITNPVSTAISRFILPAIQFGDVASPASKSTLNMLPRLLVHTLWRIASLIPTGAWYVENPRVLCSYVSFFSKSNDSLLYLYSK